MMICSQSSPPLNNLLEEKMNLRSVMKAVFFGVIALLWAMPKSPPMIYAGDGECTQDLTGTQKNCNGRAGLLCYSGVKTCGTGTKLSACSDGTDSSSGGVFKCNNEDSNCSGVRYHPKTDTTGCKAASVENPIEVP